MPPFTHPPSSLSFSLSPSRWDIVGIWRVSAAAARGWWITHQSLFKAILKQTLPPSVCPPAVSLWAERFHMACAGFSERAEHFLTVHAVHIRFFYSLFITAVDYWLIQWNFSACVCLYSFLTLLMSFSMGLRQELGMLALSLARLNAWEAANGPLAFRLKARADLILWGNNK